MRLLALALLLSGVPAAAGEPGVGFIWHYPFAEAGDDLIGPAGATRMISRAAWAVIEPTEGQYDFSTLDRQMALARQGGFRLLLLLECNQFCSPGWLRQKVRAAGQSACHPDGNPVDMPGLTSSAFAEAQDRFVRQVLSHVRTHDRHRVITGYQGGIEWWFPPEYRFGPGEIALFRQWLAGRYGTIAALNAAWQTRWTQFSEVEPPRTLAVDMWRKGPGGPRPFQVFPGGGFTGNLRVASADWEAFWSQAAADALNRLASLVKRYDPSRPRGSFQSIAFAAGSEWDYTQWSAMRIDTVAAGARDLDALGMQLVASGGDPYRIGVGLDIARKYGKPLWDLDLLDFTDGVAAGPRVMSRATHTAIAHGASELYYCCWNGAKDFNFHPDWPLPEIQRMLRDAKQSLALTRGLSVQADGALVVPYVPSWGEPSGFPNDVASLMGWYKLLQACQLTCDLFTLEELAQDCLSPATHPWVLVPDCPCLPAASLAALERYARAGGLVITAGRFAAEEPSGKRLAAPAFPLLNWTDWGRAYAGDLSRDARAGDTPPMAQWSITEPAQFRAWREARRAVEAALPRRAVRLLPASPYVACTRLAGEGRSLLYLINSGPAPVSGLRLGLSSEALPGPASLTAWADGREATAPCASASGRLWVALPEFTDACLVQVPQPRPANPRVVTITRPQELP